MKKSIFAIIAAITLFAWGCQNDSNNNEVPQELVIEIDSLQNVATEMDSIKTEIEQSATKLDDLLEDL